MKKKIFSIFLIIMMTSVLLASCFIAPEQNLSAINRPKESTDTEYILIFDDEVIALSGDPNLISAVSVSILNSINNQRAAAGLSAFIQTNELVAAATIRAKEQEQSFSHTRPDGSAFWTCNSAVCYGECLSRGYNENEVVNAWMNSPSHKAILMDKEYKTAGIGYYENNGICYIALETGY